MLKCSPACARRPRRGAAAADTVQWLHRRLPASGLAAAAALGAASGRAQRHLAAGRQTQRAADSVNTVASKGRGRQTTNGPTSRCLPVAVAVHGEQRLGSFHLGIEQGTYSTGERYSDERTGSEESAADSPRERRGTAERQPFVGLPA